MEMRCHRNDISRHEDLPVLHIDDHLQRLETLDTMNEWRHASRVPVAGRCLLLVEMSLHFLLLLLLLNIVIKASVSQLMTMSW